MANSVIQLPIDYFGKFSQDRAIFNGSVYIGEPGTDPQIVVNQKSITGLQQDGTEVALSQPVSIGSGGYMTYNGSPIRVLTDGNYSLKVLDKSGNQIYFFENVEEGIPVTFNDNPVLYRSNVASVISDNGLSIGQVVETLGYTSSGDGGAGVYLIVAGGTGTADGGSFINTSNGNQMQLISNKPWNILQFGATTSDTALNNGNALSNLISTGGKVVINSGAWSFELTSTTLTNVLPNIKSLDLIGTATITIPTIQQVFTESVQVDNDLSKLSIVGQTPVSLSITSQQSVGGSAGDYSVTLNVSTTSGFNTGDYLHTTDVTGTDAEIHRGAWEITNIDSGNSRITVKNTARNSSFPSNTITASESFVITSVLQWNDTDAFVVDTGRIGFINNLAVVGNSDSYWSSGDVNGTEKGTHGFLIGSQTIALNGKPENPNPFGVSEAHVSCGPVVGVNNFDQQGVVCELGGTFWGDFVSSCNNKRRGFYASTSAGIRAKHISANGNFLDGVITDIGGSAFCTSESSACGNGGAGVSSTQNGSLLFDTGYVKFNLSDGVRAVASGFVQITNAEIIGNQINGILCEYGGSCYPNNSEISNNADDGIQLSFNGTARALNCTINDNGGFGVNSQESSIAITTGTTLSGNTSGDYSSRNYGASFNGSEYFIGTTETQALEVLNDTTRTGYRLGVTGAGDAAVIQFDIVGLGTFTDKYVFRETTEGFYPVDDGSYKLGRISNRWSEVFAVNGSINTSDERDKEVYPIDDAVLDAWAEIEYCQYKWKDMIEQKGESARIHTGLLAQDIERAFSKHGLDATKYGLFCYDSWENEFDDEGNIVLKAGDRFGIRSSQCLFLEAALTRRELNKLKNK